MDAARQDFVKVKLTALGERLAGEGELLVIEGRHEFTFKAGQVRDDITRAFDWDKVLKTQNRDGEPLFELVEVDGRRATVDGEEPSQA